MTILVLMKKFGCEREGGMPLRSAVKMKSINFRENVYLMKNVNFIVKAERIHSKRGKWKSWLIKIPADSYRRMCVTIRMAGHSARDPTEEKIQIPQDFLRLLSNWKEHKGGKSDE